MRKKKKIDRKKLFYTLGFFIFCVFGLTVVYSALSTTLNISGSANVTQSSWGIVIEEYPVSDFYIDEFQMDVCSGLASFKCVGNALVWGNANVEKFPVIEGTSIKDFSLSVSIPDDSVSLLYKVMNTGTIPAKLESINTYTPTYTSVNNNSSDVLWAQNNVEVGSYIVYPGSEMDEVPVGTILCPGERINLLLGMSISNSVTTLPTNSVVISNGGVVYNFVQADISTCS